MELYRNASPAAVGVPRKLLPRDLEASGAGAYPYCAAARELGLLVLESCPQKKLECIGEGRAPEGGRGRTRSDKAPSRRLTWTLGGPRAQTGLASCPLGVCLRDRSYARAPLREGLAPGGTRALPSWRHRAGRAGRVGAWELMRPLGSPGTGPTHPPPPCSPFSVPQCACSGSSAPAPRITAAPTRPPRRPDPCWVPRPCESQKFTARGGL